MKLWDYHTHNYRCNHAVGKIEEYVVSGIKKGLSEIGIADHFPMYLIPKEANVWQYSMKKDEFPLYLRKINEIKQKYANKITVKVATEVDYYPDALEGYKKALKPYLPELDYLIGSIHVIKINKRAWGVDNEDNPEGLRDFGKDLVYQKYYEQQIDLVNSGFYNILGHCDLPKKYGIRPKNKEKIWELQLKLLDTLEDSKMAMEINTSGFYKPVKEQYPEKKIIKEAIRCNIPICLGSDAHHPEKVAYEFQKALKMAKKLGLTNLCKFSNGNLETVEI